MGSLSGGQDNARFVRESGLAAEFAGLAEPILAGLGLRLVRVKLTGKDEATVQIMAERPDGTMSIEDCGAVSKQLSPLLDVHDPMAGGYRLEISSPGVDRPLVRASDFELWAGHLAKIELHTLLDGRKRFKGRLEGFEDGEIRIEVELDGIGRRVLGLPVALVADAKLIMTDELVRCALRRTKTQDTQDTADTNDDADKPDAT